MGGIESIWIIFVIWAIISGIISKNKEKTKREAQANQPPRPVAPPPYFPNTPSPESAEAIEARQEELRRCLQAKKQAAKKSIPAITYVEGESEYPQSSIFAQQEPFFDSETTSKISVNITKPGQFNQEALFNAVIMSEILGKPKALRRR